MDIGIMNNIKHINLAYIGEDILSRPYGFVEFWNPTVQQLLNLASYLEENSTLAFVWLYGEPESIEDYSPLFEKKLHRIVEPIWLGFTKESAYELYKEIRQAYLGDSV